MHAFASVTFHVKNSASLNPFSSKQPRNMFKVTLVAFLMFSASFSSSIVDNWHSDNSAKRAMLTF